MRTRLVLMTILMVSASSAPAGTSAPNALKDLHFGEALYYAFQGDWFDSISRLDTELMQHRRVDEPERDTLHVHVGQAEFDVGDFELAYRMHQRAGRAFRAVIEGDVGEPVRNEAIFRLARLYFQKDRPADARDAVERVSGAVPPGIRDDLDFLRAQIHMANGRFGEAARVLGGLRDAKALEGFATYNLGIALIKDGKEPEGREQLDRAGRIRGDDELSRAIRDKANLVLGFKRLKEKDYDGARLVLDRVSLDGAFSNRALLAAGWADAFQGRFESALAPWSVLVTREVTDAPVQEAMLAVPFAYGKLNMHSKAAVMYGGALEALDAEIGKIEASIRGIREGHFLRALAREEFAQDADWVVKLRRIPRTPETYYLLDLMASHDFQESLKNYLDLEQLRRRLEARETDLDAFEEIVARRRAYYQPLLPVIDREFRRLDSQMRLRLEQRDRVERRLAAMLAVPRPDYLATAGERVVGERLALLERTLAARGTAAPGEAEARVRRLRGALTWNLLTEYDSRFTEAHKHLRDLTREVDLLKKRYAAFVRARQAATQSYEGFEDAIRRQRSLVGKARETVGELMARQGRMLETMAVNELAARGERLAEYKARARFAIADSYDRASRARGREGVDK